MVSAFQKVRKETESYLVQDGAPQWCKLVYKHHENILKTIVVYSSYIHHSTTITNHRIQPLIRQLSYLGEPSIPGIFWSFFEHLELNLYDLVGLDLPITTVGGCCRVALVDHLPITFHDVEGKGAAVRIDQVADLQFGQRMTQLSWLPWGRSMLQMICECHGGSKWSQVEDIRGTISCKFTFKQPMFHFWVGVARIPEQLVVAYIGGWHPSTAIPRGVLVLRMLEKLKKYFGTCCGMEGYLILILISSWPSSLKMGAELIADHASTVIVLLGFA